MRAVFAAQRHQASGEPGARADAVSEAELSLAALPCLSTKQKSPRSCTMRPKRKLVLPVRSARRSGLPRQEELPASIATRAVLKKPLQRERCQIAILTVCSALYQWWKPPTGKGLTMLKFIGVLTAASIVAFTTLTPVRAAGGKACLQNCRAELQRNGTWTSFPKGYCRNKCNYYGPGR